MNMKNLLKTWTLPDRTTDRAQITLRLSFNEYARLHALKEVYKHRSVNDMINDILKAGLDEIIESLPSYQSLNEPAEAAYLAHEYGGQASDYEYVTEGPRVQFDNAYRKILESKPEEETKKLEVVND